ncbi:MAG: hypothetical protein QOH97_3570 [Actinoplanes sp.]|nr:hypothetical protein [Actinoplanes sp.]
MPQWQSITDTGSLEPSPEALAWAQRADQWAQQPNLPEQRGHGQWEGGQVSRWSEVVPTGATPAEGVGWRTETAEWRATTARWSQTTEWRSTSGTHGWRSTTEAWQTGQAGAEGFPPSGAPPTGGPLALSSGSWAAEQQPESYQPDDGSYRTESYTPPSDTPRANGWQQGTPSPSSWQQPAPAPPWQQGVPSPSPWETQAGVSWQHVGPQDGRHLVRADDRAQWRQSAAGAAGLGEQARQAGRRRAPEDGSARAGVGTGWSTRSEADNWAGHTDTGSMPMFPDAALGGWPETPEHQNWHAEDRAAPQASDWRTRGGANGDTPDWRTTGRANGDTPDWRTTGQANGDTGRANGAVPDDWPARLEASEWEEPDSPSRRTQPETSDWRARTEAPDWRTQRPAAPESWRDARESPPPAQDDWRTRSIAPGRRGDADIRDWRTAAPAEAPDWRTDPRGPADPRTDGRDAPDWRTGEAEREEPDRRTQSGAAPWGPQDTGRRRVAADDWREAPDDTDMADWRTATSSSGWRTEDAEPPRRRAAAEASDWDSPESDSWREPEAPPRRAQREQDDWRREGPAADPWQHNAAEARQQPEPADWDESRRLAAYDPYRRPAIEPPPRRRAEIEAPVDDEPRGSGMVGPELWQGAERPDADRQSWREPQDDARTQSWLRDLREERDPPVDEAATENRQVIDRPAARRGGDVPGSASYRGSASVTGDWRRGLAAESGLADGESRRFGTSDFVPFQTPDAMAAEATSVPAARTGAEPLAVSQTGTGRWQDPPDTQWPPRTANGYNTASTGSYERRPVSTLPTASGRQNNLLEPDEDEIEESTGSPLAAVGYTVIWYGVPVVLFVLYMLVLNRSEQAHALSTLAAAAPQFGLSLVLSMLVAVGLRWASGSWTAASVGLAAAVMGGGLATVLTSAITGNSLS